MGGTIDKVSTYLLQPEGSQEETNESDPRLEARSPADQRRTNSRRHMDLRWSPWPYVAQKRGAQAPSPNMGTADRKSK